MLLPEHLKDLRQWSPSEQHIQNVSVELEGIKSLYYQKGQENSSKDRYSLEDLQGYLDILNLCLGLLHLQ